MILHILGFHHEHTRSDRHHFLDIVLKNVVLHKRKNFNIQRGTTAPKYPYDYRSIMQVSQTAFGMGEVTMKTKDEYYNELIGTGTELSKLDIVKINDMYNCPEYKGPSPRKSTPECHDDASDCGKYASDGYCVEDWCSKKCPMSCKLCNIGQVTYPPVPTLKPTVATTVEGCKDHSGLCRFLKKQCEAMTDDGKQIRKQCPLTCKKCK